MNCYNHPLRQGVNTCSKCGAWLCDECSIEADGRIVCKSCVSRHPSGAKRGVRVPNVLLLLMFSGLPGANYMYMGLIKRGLFIMTGFFLSIYLSGLFHIFGFVTAGIAITSLFDGMRIRRRIIEGEDVPDDTDDLKAFFATNKVAIIAVMAVIVALEIIQDASQILFRGISVYSGAFARHSGRLSPAIALIAVALGIYFLSKFFSKKPKCKSDDVQ